MLFSASKVFIQFDSRKTCELSFPTITAGGFSCFIWFSGRLAYMSKEADVSWETWVEVYWLWAVECGICEALIQLDGSTGELVLIILMSLFEWWSNTLPSWRLWSSFLSQELWSDNSWSIWNSCGFRSGSWHFRQLSYYYCWDQTRQCGACCMV